MGGQLLADNIIDLDQDREGPAVIQPGKGGFADGSVIAIQRQRVGIAANDGPGKTILSIDDNEPRQAISAAPGKIEYQPISVAPSERQPISFEVPGKSAPARIDISDNMPGKSPAALDDVAIPIGISASRVDLVAILSGKNGFDGLGDERQPISASPGKVEYQPISVAPPERQPISVEMPGKSAPARIEISDAMPGKIPAVLENVAIPIGVSASRVDLASTLPGKNSFDGLGDDRQPISASPGKVEYQPISVAPPERQPISVEMPGKSAPERIEISDSSPGKSTFSVSSEIRTEPAAVLPGKGAANDSTYDNVIRVDPAVFTSGKNDFSQTAPPVAISATVAPKSLDSIGFSLADISGSMSTGNGGGLLSKLNASMGGAPAQPAAPATSALDDLAKGSGNGRFDQSVYERAKAAMKTSGPGA